MLDQYSDEDKAKWLNNLYEKHPELSSEGFAERLQAEIQESKAIRTDPKSDIVRLKSTSNLKPATEEQKQKEKEYIRQVKNCPSKVECLHKTIPTNLMPIKDAKNRLWSIIKADLANQRRSFIHDGNLLQVIGDLLLYFIRSDESKLDINKGLYIYGTVGIGKTWLIKMFKIFCDTWQLPTSFRIHEMPEVVAQIRQAESLALISEYVQGICFYDDVGTEPPTIQIYGDKASIYGQIILMQYKRFKGSGKPMHSTSNLKPEQIRDIYGEREYSRAKEMFNFVFLHTSAKR